MVLRMRMPLVLMLLRLPLVGLQMIHERGILSSSRYR